MTEVLGVGLKLSVRKFADVRRELRERLQAVDYTEIAYDVSGGTLTADVLFRQTTRSGRLFETYRWSRLHGWRKVIR